jgi:hypothetical protein
VESDRPQHDRLAVSFIAQQYSSATFNSLRYHPSKEKKLRAFTESLFQLFYLLRLCKFEIV